MSLPASVAAQLDSIRAQCRSRQPRWGEAGARIPVERYRDPAVWQAERRHLFRALPVVAAHASELAPGQALAQELHGLPLLLTRDAGGRAHAFLNVCRHRGMRLLEADGAVDRASLSCPYHGWTYQLDGRLRHRLHAEAFDACPPGANDLVALPCAERHGLLWVLPDPQRRLDLDAFLGGLGAELDASGLAGLRLFRTVEADYAANWKLIVDAFLEPYHIRVLHRDTIYPFFADGITAAQRFGPHISSLVARRTALDWADADAAAPDDYDALRRLATPSQVIFPNTITIFHPDYLSLITLQSPSPETLRWTHRMLVPADKLTPDWAPHWEKTFRLIEQGVFQREDIHCAVQIQQGLASGANSVLTAGRMEQALGWFHDSVAAHAGLAPAVD